MKVTKEVFDFVKRNGRAPKAVQLSESTISRVKNSESLEAYRADMVADKRKTKVIEVIKPTLKERVISVFKR